VSNEEMEIMKDYEWIIDSAMVALLVIFVANMIGGAV
jgi:hypothetical protein